jgi:hypothetical protein
VLLRMKRMILKVKKRKETKRRLKNIGKSFWVLFHPLQVTSVKSLGSVIYMRNRMATNN